MTSDPLSFRERVVERATHWVPLLGFVGGFAFDSFTLGTEVKWYDLVVLSVYAVGAAWCLIATTRGWLARWTPYIVFACQFALGAMFSALVVLYFKSAGGIAPTVFVVGLFASMVANEFLHKYERARDLIWAMFALTMASWLNFLLPYVLKSVSPIWFYVSTTAAAGVVVAVARLAGTPFRNLRAAAATLAVLVAMFVAEVVPPVPLVQHRSVACTGFEKVQGEYTCRGVAQRWWQRYLGITPTVTAPAGEPVYVMTSVWAPEQAEATLEHRWYRWSESDGWQSRDTMEIKMVGGRRDGWRFWTRKRNVTPGVWRVDTALQGGGVVGTRKFEVVIGPAVENVTRL